MTDADGAPDAPAVPASAGDRLRAAREAKGMALADVAARTRVPLRHLQAIESGDYAGLPSPTYAVGFARAYARAVDADEVAVAAAVREEVSKIGRAPEYEPYATADPDRVPSRGLAIVAAGLALAIVVLALLWFGTSWWQARQPAVATTEAPVAAPTPAVVSRSVPAPTNGQVKLTATDEVWLRVADAAGKTLYIGTLKPGESFDVPAGADHPTLTVGRPDKLQVTLDGKALPPLGTGERPIKNVAVDGTAIAARLAASGPVPVITPTPATVTPSTPPAAPRVANSPQTSDKRATARANRSSGRAAARGEAPPAPVAAAGNATTP